MSERLSTKSAPRHERPCIHCAPPAWDYPPRGSITASCGHKLYGNDTGEGVTEWDWDFDGLVMLFSNYCPWCALRAKVSGRYITEEALVG